MVTWAFIHEQVFPLWCDRIRSVQYAWERVHSDYHPLRFDDAYTRRIFPERTIQHRGEAQLIEDEAGDLLIEDEGDVQAFIERIVQEAEEK